MKIITIKVACRDNEVESLMQSLYEIKEPRIYGIGVIEHTVKNATKKDKLKVKKYLYNN